MGEVHTGIKFEIVRLSGETIDDPRIEDLIGAGRTLSAMGFCPKDCGNLSFRYAGGFVITPVRADIGNLHTEDLVLVRDVDPDDRKVFVAGEKTPSSEAIMHFLIYRARPDISVILHAHALHLKNAVSTKKAWPYGTLESARAATDALKDHDLVILKDHGFVSVGRNVEEALGRIR